MNGQTGKAHGQRPYGVGNMLGGGIGMLEDMFGINDLQNAGILSGQVIDLQISTYINFDLIKRH